MAKPLTVADCAHWDVVIVTIDNQRRQLALTRPCSGGYRARDSWQDETGYWRAPETRQGDEFLPNGLPILERIRPDYARGRVVTGGEFDPLMGGRR